jgi:hypothetical protein
MDSFMMASEECWEPDEVCTLRRCLGLASIIKFMIKRNHEVHRCFSRTAAICPKFRIRSCASGGILCVLDTVAIREPKIGNYFELIVLRIDRFCKRVKKMLI